MTEKKINIVTKYAKGWMASVAVMGGIDELTAGQGLELDGNTIQMQTVPAVAGSYTNPVVTVDSTGRITSIQDGAAADAVNADVVNTVDDVDSYDGEATALIVLNAGEGRSALYVKDSSDVFRGPAFLTGAAGLNGTNGTDGTDGDVGPKGDKGDKGERGETGLQGPVGPQGPEGPRGQAGANGQQGPQGIQGVAGQNGTAARMTVEIWNSSLRVLTSEDSGKTIFTSGEFNMDFDTPANLGAGFWCEVNNVEGNGFVTVRAPFGKQIVLYPGDCIRVWTDSVETHFLFIQKSSTPLLASFTFTGGVVGHFVELLDMRFQDFDSIRVVGSRLRKTADGGLHYQVRQGGIWQTTGYRSGITGSSGGNTSVGTVNNNYIASGEFSFTLDIRRNWELCQSVGQYNTGSPASIYGTCTLPVADFDGIRMFPVSATSTAYFVSGTLRFFGIRD